MQIDVLLKAAVMFAAIKRDRAMQMDHIARSGTLQKVIHILRDIHQIRGDRQCAMGAVRLCGCDCFSPRVVPLDDQIRIARKALRRGERHRIELRPQCATHRFCIAKRRHARLSAESRAGEAHDSRRRTDQVPRVGDPLFDPRLVVVHHRTQPPWPPGSELRMSDIAWRSCAPSTSPKRRMISSNSRRHAGLRLSASRPSRLIHAAWSGWTAAARS